MRPVRLARVAVYDPSGKRMRRNVPDAERVQRSVTRILNENLLCSMATVAGRRAHINAAYFCYSDALDLFFLSHPDSLHCRNLAKNASMAVMVFSTSQTWLGADVGVQLFGRCAEARGGRRMAAEHLYARRFRQYAKWKMTVRAGDTAAEYRFYRFVPEQLRLLDEKSFGDAMLVEARIKRAG